MDVTEELCRLLDEQGLEWREHEAPAAECIAFFDGNGWHDCWESVGGEVNVTFSMTPEQAIAATLGTGTCRDVADAPQYGDKTRFECSECGYEYSAVGGFGCDYGDEPDFRFCPNCGRRCVG